MTAWQSVCASFDPRAIIVDPMIGKSMSEICDASKCLECSASREFGFESLVFLALSCNGSIELGLKMLDYWREYFRSSNGDILETIEKAIMVAASDYP
ncbi:hypothetical protein Tco_1375302 [Tanacetum coccineum]